MMSRRRIARGEGVAEFLRYDAATAASTAVSAASGVWLRRVLLAVAAFETLVGGLIDLAVSVPDLNARLFIHPLLAIAALVLAARRYLRAAIVVRAAYILVALAIGWSVDFALGGLSLLAQQVIFGPLAVTAIVLAILDKLLWLGRFSSRCRRQTCSWA